MHSHLSQQTAMFLCFLLLLLFAQKYNAVCPLNSTFSEQFDRCFAYLPQALDWNSANQQCKTFGESSHLVNAKSGFFNNFIAGNVSPNKQSVWIENLAELSKRRQQSSCAE